MKQIPYFFKNVAFVLGALSIINKLILPTIGCVILFTIMEMIVEMEK